MMRLRSADRVARRWRRMRHLWSSARHPRARRAH